MMFPLFRRRSRQDTISTLYGTIVAQARLPCFYREYGVADTVNGRFDLLVVHLALVIDRLAEEPDSREAGQALFDHFCRDMDHNLREMGIGDLSVPKGNAAHRRSVLRSSAGLQVCARGAWRGRISRGFDKECLWGFAAIADRPLHLAAYIREAVRDVGVQRVDELLAGKLRLPNPDVIVPVEDKDR